MWLLLSLILMRTRQIGIVSPSGQAREVTPSLAVCLARDQVVGQHTAPRLGPEERKGRGARGRNWVSEWVFHGEGGR